MSGDCINGLEENFTTSTSTEIKDTPHHQLYRNIYEQGTFELEESNESITNLEIGTIGRTSQNLNFYDKKNTCSYDEKLSKSVNATEQ